MLQEFTASIRSLFVPNGIRLILPVLFRQIADLSRFGGLFLFSSVPDRFCQFAYLPNGAMDFHDVKTI
jgi:hypothetical protein